MKVFSYQTLKEAQKNISEKNWNSFFSRIAKTFHKGSPVELGIFYYFKGRIYKSSKPWNDENIFKKDSGWRSLDIVHEDAWQELRKNNPELPNTDWMTLPRGRVYFDGREFVVNVDPVLEEIPNFKNLVISAFNLPPEGTAKESGADQRITRFDFDQFYSYTEDKEVWI